MRYLRLLLLWAVAGSLQAQDLPGRWRVEAFTPEQYKSHPQIWAITQDARGILHIANNNGVMRYDGVRFEDLPAPGGAVVRSLATDPAGRVWYGSQRDFGVIEADATGQPWLKSLVGELDSTEADFGDVWKTYATHDTQYFFTVRKIIRRTAAGYTFIRPERGFYFPFLVDGVLYAQEPGRGLFRVEGDSLVAVPGGDTFAQRPIFSLTATDVPGRLLAATADHGLFAVTAAGAEHVPSEAHAWLVAHKPYHGIRLSDGRHAIATRTGGVVVLAADGLQAEILNKERGLPNDIAWYVYQDREGGLWTGHDLGFSRTMVEYPIRSFDESDGLVGTVEAVVRHQGRLFAATRRGLFRMGRHGFEPVPGFEGDAWALLDLGDRLLVGGARGLFEWRNGRLRRLPTPEPAATVLALHRSPGDGTHIWLGTREGAHRMRRDGDRWVVTTPENAPTGEIRRIFEHQGRLWFQTSYTGLLRYEPERRFTHPEQFGRNDLSMHLVGDTLWVNDTERMYRYHAEADSFVMVPDFAQGSLINLRAMWTGTDGAVWLAARVGAHNRLSRMSAAGMQRYPVHQWLGELAMLSVLPEADGTIWVTHPAGLLRFQPDQAPPSVAPGEPLIRSVLLNQDSLWFAGMAPGHLPDFDMRPDARSIRINFASPSFGIGRPVGYRTYLEGFDPDWSAISTETFREYTSLPAGTYVFRVKAVGADGTESVEGRFLFTVQPPWYASAWFLAGMLLLTGYLGYRAVDHRIRVLRDRDRMQARQHQLDMIGRIGASVTHDIRNTVFSLGMLTRNLEKHFDDPEFRKDAIETLDTVGHHLETLVRRFQERPDQWNPQIRDTKLADTVRAAVRRALPEGLSTLTLRMEIDDQVRVPHDPDLLGRVVENLVRNAVDATTGTGTVTIRHRTGSAEHVVEIEDTGRGMDADFIRHKLFQPFATTKANGLGLGLYSCREIVLAHGGAISARSTPGQGSVFEIRLPAHS